MSNEEIEDAVDFNPEKMTPEQRFSELAGLLAAGLLRIRKGCQENAAGTIAGGSIGNSTQIHMPE
ncbi:MAG: hypothetical protein ACOYI9_08795 [Candidatus Hydrogenedentales bacterium]|jgi:hypothetical protein